MRVWNQSGKLLKEFDNPNQQIATPVSLAQGIPSTQRIPGFLKTRFSPDGRKLIANTWNQVLVWDVETGKELTRIAPSASVQVLENGNSLKPQIQPKTLNFFTLDSSFSRDGKRQSFLTLIPAGKLVKQLDSQNKPISFQTIPAKSMLAFFDPASQRWATQLDLGEQFVIRYIFSSDEQFFLTVGLGIKDVLNEPTRAVLWKATGEKVAELGKATDAEFSPDGRFVTTVNRDGMLQSWNLLGQRRDNIQVHQGAATSLAFSPDGKWVATAGNDGLVKVWSRNNQLPSQFRHRKGDDIAELTFSPNSKQLAVSGVSGIELWNINPSPAIHRANVLGKFEKASFSSDRKFIAVSQAADGLAVTRVFNISGQQIASFLTGQETLVQIKQLPSTKPSLPPSPLPPLDHLPTETLLETYWKEVSLSPDGKMIAIGEDHGKINIWDIRKKKVKTTFAPPCKRKRLPLCIITFEFSGDSRKILTNESGSNEIKVWNLAGKNLATFEVDGIGRIHLTPDRNKIIGSSKDGKSVSLWNLDGQKIADINVSGVSAFSPDEKLIAVINANDVSIKNSQGQEISTLHHSAISHVSFSPDGTQVVTTGQDGMMRLWSLSGQQTGELQLTNKPAIRAEFTPDGKQVIAISEDGMIAQYPVETLDELLSRGCSWLQDYLDNNAVATSEDKQLCADIPRWDLMFFDVKH